MPLTLNQLKLMILSPNSDSLESTVHMLRGNIHDKENEKNIILVINSLLSNSKTRGTGLELINELIPYCSVEVLIENIMFWSSNCVVHLNTQDSLKEIKLRTIEKIIGNMAEVESFNKKFIQEYLFDTVKACLTYHCNTEKSACLKCLSQCMKIYPSWFGNHSEKIESFLIKLLEDTNGEVKDAALVFHLFNQTGSAGVDGIHHINNFRNRFQKLCATVHALYNTFFENIREINNSERVDAEVFTFSYSQPNSDSHRFLEATAFRIINCLLFIKTMIAKQFPVEKQIIPKHVIDIINRGLSMHICFSEESSLLCHQSALLNKIQLKLLELLRIFIIGNHSSLLPFSHALSKIILNTLKRTNSCSCFVNDSSYKVIAYKVLNSWLSVSKSINDSRLQENLISLLLEDIRPVKKKILLNPNFSKKKSKAVKHSEDKNDINERTLHSSSNFTKESSCIIALDVLKRLFTTHPVTVNQLLLQEVVSLITRILAAVQMNRINAPYTNITCQIKLYEVLISLFKQECKKIDLPVHLITSMLHRGLKSVNYKISETSREGLDLFEKISHPVCASLYIDDSLSQYKKNKMVNSNLNEIECENCNNSNEESLKEVTQDLQLLIQEPVTSVDTKEINILSNILISDLVCKRHTADNEEMKGEESEQSLKGKDIDIIPQISEVKMENNLTGPPKKKTKTKDNTLETMFYSFQDVIQ